MVMYDTEIDQSKVTSLYYKAFNLVKSTGITPVYDAYLSAEAAEVINNGLQEIMMGGPSKVWPRSAGRASQIRYSIRNHSPLHKD